MKKLLSVLLVIAMLLTSVSTGLLGFAAITPTKSKAIVTLSVAPAADSFKWGDEIVFNVSATNNTEQDYENIKIRASANKTKFFYDGDSNTVIIDELKAGETKEIQIKVASSKPNILQQVFILPIYYIIDYLSPMAFNANNFDATTLVKVGVFKYKFGFDVTDGNEKAAQKSVNLAFDLNYDDATEEIATQKLNAGEKAEPVVAPTRNGYSFMGWFTDASCEEQYRFSFILPIYDDLTVYAKWEKISTPSDLYTVSFKLNYDGAANSIPEQTVAAGELATVVNDPSREGFEFTGWYSDSACEEAFDFNTPITSDTILYAGWEEIEIVELSISIDQDNFETTDNVANISGRYTCDNLDTIAYVVDPFFYETGSSTTGEVIIDGNRWSTSIVLKPGDNKINFTVKSLAGEEETVFITISYSIGSVVEYDDSDISIDTDEGIEYINNVIGVYFEENTTAAEIDEVVQYLNGEYAGVNYPLNQYWIRIQASTLSELYDICDELEERFDYIITACIDELTYNASISANDPWNGDVNASDWLDDDVDGSNWGLEAIEAPEAWNYLNRMSSVKVGVVDNGFTTTNDDSDFFFIMSDDNNVSTGDHGSHVAGTIGATSNNEKGITGVMYNKGRVLCYDAAPNGSLDSSRIDNGFTKLVTSGAKAINFSLGSSGNLSDHNSTFSEKTINSAGKSASTAMLKLLEKKDNAGNRLYDFVVVQSAGNGASDGIGVNAINNKRFCSVTRDNCKSNNKVSKDDILNRIIIVANAEQNDEGYRLRSSSNSGGTTTIAAPGTNIYSIVNDSYGFKSGTSMAAPHVTGVAGLVWAINRDFTGADVKDIIVNSTKDDVFDNPASPNATGNYRLVNAKLAVEEAIRRTDALGTFKARFTDAADGYALLGVKMKCTAYEGHYTGTMVGNEYIANSDQAELQLPAGTYTFQFTYADYIPAIFTFTIRANETTNLNNISLSKEIGDNEVRVVLHWGTERPSDLDSHFNGKKSDGSIYHVYYSAMGSRDVAWLDIDDISYEGPETITINMNNFEDFTYSVHNFSDRSSTSGSSGASVLAASGAYVEVFVGTAKVATYNVPTNRYGTVWNVFKMDKNGTITFINSFEYNSDPSSVGYVR